MELEDIKKVIDMLKEADFNIVDMSENPDDIEMYYTASEIARRLDVRLDNETINKAMCELGYKTFYEKIGLPTNPENSSVTLKSFENEDTGEKDYYLQCLWDKSLLEDINGKIMNNSYFESKKIEIEAENNAKRNELLSDFQSLDEYVVMSVKKTGFNLKKDFIIYISYVIFSKSDKKILSSGYIFVDDDIDDEKINRYTEKNELTDMSPFDYIKIPLPTMDDSNFDSLFLDRLEALRHIYKISNKRNIIFYSEQEERFINKLFEKEDIPEDHLFKNVKKRSFYFKDIVDWIESKESFKLRDIYNRYQIVENKGEGFKKDAMMLNYAIIKFLDKYKGTNFI